MTASESTSYNEQAKPIQVRRIIALIAGAVVTASFIALTGIVGTAQYLVKRVTTPRRSRRPATFTFTPWEFQIPYRTVRIPVDADELDAWLLQQDDKSAPAVLLLSGFGGNKSELLGIASALYRAGYTCFMFDYRGTGRSTGEMITLGHSETDDARAALDWLSTALPNAPIAVMGYSLGGSIAITLGATDARVRAVVADSAFASQYGVLAHHVRRATRLHPMPVLAAAAPMFKRKHQRTYADFAPADIIDRIAPRPLLLIHPEHDAMVPTSEAMELLDNAGEPKEFWFVEGTGHCGAYFEDREAYCKRVIAFLRGAMSSDDIPTAPSR